MSTVLNRSSVKRFALNISAVHRAGKFTRVGSEFYLRCEARLESEIRGLVTNDIDAPTQQGLSFITKLARNKVEERLETLARKIIYTEVIRHPSLGKTLK